MAEVLVVTSKVKKYIKESGGCNTSAETVAARLDVAVRPLDHSGVAVPAAGAACSRLCRSHQSPFASSPARAEYAQ